MENRLHEFVTVWLHFQIKRLNIILYLSEDVFYNNIWTKQVCNKVQDTFILKCLLQLYPHLIANTMPVINVLSSWICVSASHSVLQCELNYMSADITLHLYLHCWCRDDAGLAKHRRANVHWEKRYQFSWKHYHTKWKQLPEKLEATTRKVGSIYLKSWKHLQKGWNFYQKI